MPSAATLVRRSAPQSTARGRNGLSGFEGSAAALGEYGGDDRPARVSGGCGSHPRDEIARELMFQAGARGWRELRGAAEEVAHPQREAVVDGGQVKARRPTGQLRAA